MTRPAAMSERSWGLWVATWRGLGAALRPLPYYPLWEVELYGVLLEQIDDIAAIFRHYAAGPPGGEITSGPAAGAPLATGFEDIQLSKEEWAGLLVDCGLLGSRARGRDAISSSASISRGRDAISAAISSSAKIGAEARRANPNPKPNPTPNPTPKSSPSPNPNLPLTRRAARWPPTPPRRAAPRLPRSQATTRYKGGAKGDVGEI